MDTEKEALRETQVQQQLNKIANAIERLEDSIEDLTKRLGGVLSQSSKSEPKEVPLITEARVPLANNLCCFAESIIKATTQINDIANRLEL